MLPLSLLLLSLGLMQVKATVPQAHTLVSVAIGLVCGFKGNACFDILIAFWKMPGQVMVCLVESHAVQAAVQDS